MVRDVKWLNKMCHECRKDAGKKETEEGSDSSSGIGYEDKGKQEEGEEVKVKVKLTSEDWREVEEGLITSMSQFREIVDSRQVSEDTSDLSEEVRVRTRGQRKAEEVGAKLKKSLVELQVEAERFVGGKMETTERGLGARSVCSDENELWKNHCRWSDKWWDEEVKKKVEH